MWPVIDHLIVYLPLISLSVEMFFFHVVSAPLGLRFSLCPTLVTWWSCLLKKTMLKNPQTSLLLPRIFLPGIGRKECILSEFKENSFVDNILLIMKFNIIWSFFLIDNWDQQFVKGTSKSHFSRHLGSVVGEQHCFYSVFVTETFLYRLPVTWGALLILSTVIQSTLCH